jgi:HPt (histidine-containing phosphotransfer) domain-containing protein/HAMP domain-containing protein
MKLSIRHKLTALAFTVLLAVTVGLTAFFSRRELASMRHDLAAKSTTYAQLLSRETEPAVAFDDQQTAREIMEATAQDTDVRSIVLYATDGHAIGTVGDPVTPPDHDVDDIETRTSSSSITSTAPVVSREGPTGVLIIEMSLDRITAARKRALVTSGFVASGALLFGLGATWLLGFALSRRLQRVQRATKRVASGDLTANEILDDSSDEIGLLARDFNVMTAALRDHVRTIEETARSENERLDALVGVRTRELSQRNRDMALLLDNVNQGFLTVSSTGELTGERSRILSTWFGPIASGETLSLVLDRAQPGAGEAFAVGLSALCDDLLPRELLIEQLPAEVRANDRQLALSYRVLEDDGQLQVLVMISDATNEIERRKAEASQRDLAALCSRIVADEQAITEFLTEAGALRTQIAAARNGGHDQIVLARNIHTLKGNAALLGFSALAAACHDLESGLSDGDHPQIGALFEAVNTACKELENRAHVLLGAKTMGVELTLEEADALANAIASGAPRDEIARYVARLRLEPVQRRLRRLAEQTEALGLRLEKSVAVRVEANEVRLDATRWAPFWASFVPRSSQRRGPWHRDRGRAGGEAEVSQGHRGHPRAGDRDPPCHRGRGRWRRHRLCRAGAGRQGARHCRPGH